MAAQHAQRPPGLEVCGAGDAQGPARGLQRERPRPAAGRAGGSADMQRVCGAAPLKGYSRSLGSSAPQGYSGLFKKKHRLDPRTKGRGPHARHVPCGEHNELYNDLDSHLRCLPALS